MTIPQFTPGPWMVVAGANSKNRSIVAVNAAGNPTIFNTVSHNFAEGCEPDFANAALAAAAPDLLEALQLAEELVRTGNFIGSEDLAKFQAAIDKAVQS